MNTEKLIYLGVAMLLAVVMIYLLLPKLKANTANLFRAVIFFAAILFLGYDFYIKGKYLFIIPLMLGSAAFVVYIKKYTK